MRCILVEKLAVFIGLFVFALLVSCGNPEGNRELSDEEKRLPENALKGLQMAQGLEVQLLASEPALRNPTNIDVDHLGRIWVTEAVNYRPGEGEMPLPEGDRIVVLEDKDGDGIAETHTVFYQGPEMNAPLGICVLEDRVIVSQSPYVWVFYDDDGDLKADRKEILFQGIGGEQHDHGMHAFIAGPDGKLYFNFGNEGKTLKDKHGNVVKDQDGDEIGPEKYRQGMVFRSNPDGSEVECLGHNFRNNFELAVDSYGIMWQSDNDDDGNRGTRINYVMDYGNYGFTDEMTGAAWYIKRTNMEDSIPLRHWHLNDPGVVPNLLQTGSGSPTGIVIYEGELLPEPFRNQMIHCEPGHNVVRAYPVTKDGAGYRAEIVNILEGARDQWFRPSDVCVAPDGSLIIADWYDPVVGGHDAGDRSQGRIYRVAPRGVAYKVPVFDFNTVEGAMEALQNPNLAVRRKAWVALRAFGREAVPALEKLWRSSASPRMRARALWVLSKAEGGDKYIAEAIREENPDLRITGIRAARELDIDLLGIVRQLVNDPDPQVRRECALALRHHPSPEAAALWAHLAVQYDGKDRWYLEALGIAASRQWDRFLAAYLQEVQNPLKSQQGRDIVWRARTEKVLPMLAKLALDTSMDLKSRLRYFRSFDFIPGPEKSGTLLRMMAASSPEDTPVNALLLEHLDPEDLRGSAIAKKTLTNVLDASYGTDTYIGLVKQYQVKSETERLLELISSKPGEAVAADACRLYISFAGEEKLRQLVNGPDQDKAMKILRTMGEVGYYETLDIIQEVMLSPRHSDTLRTFAAEMLGRNYEGEYRVFDLVKENKIPEQFISPVMKGLAKGPRPSMYQRVEALLAGDGGDPGQQEAFNRDAVLAAAGDAVKGKEVFAANCLVCHQVNGEGLNLGPGLSEIGAKLPREGLLEAIISPSSGISFGFETWQVKTRQGVSMAGILASQTDSEVEIKFPGGRTDKISKEDIESLEKLPESLMPSFKDVLSMEQLADLLEYLGTLTKSN